MFETLLRRLSAVGLRRGRAGSRNWLIVASIAGGLRLLRYVTRDHEEILFRTLVAPGDQFEITTKAARKR